MKHFIDHGIEIHAQVVLCPKSTMGHISRRRSRIWLHFIPGVVSTAIVPLGVTDNHKYRDRLTPVTDDYCARVIDQMTPIQERLKAKARNRLRVSRR